LVGLVGGEEEFDREKKHMSGREEWIIARRSRERGRGKRGYISS